MLEFVAWLKGLWFLIYIKLFKQSYKCKWVTAELGVQKAFQYSEQAEWSIPFSLEPMNLELQQLFIIAVHVQFPRLSQEKDSGSDHFLLEARG